MNKSKLPKVKEAHPLKLFYGFVFLILLRPLIDIFWRVKENIPYISPLYLAGVLPFLLISFYIVNEIKVFSDKFNRFSFYLFILFGFILLLNVLSIFLYSLQQTSDEIISVAGLSIKMLSFPIFIFFLLTFLDDYKFELILRTFLIASIFPLLMILYEIFIHPINPYIPGGRGYERYRGLYSDGINYTIYWFIALITSAYFFLKYNSRITLLILSITSLIIFAGLYFLNQAVAYILFISLFVLLLYFLYSSKFIISLVKRNYIISAFFIVLLLGILIFVYIPGFEKISSLFWLDTQVIQGNASIEHGANGRIGIWLEGIRQLKEFHFYSWLFGAGLSFPKNFNYFSSGAHSDYIRILFTTGIIGLCAYLLFMASLFKGFKSFQLHDKYLLLSLIVMTVLLSVSHTPTFYLPFVYFLAAIISYYIVSKRK